MQEKFFEKVIDEVWGKWFGIPVMMFVSALVGISICTSVQEKFSYTIVDSNMTYSTPSKVGIILIVITIICLLGINIWYFLFVWSRNCIRKAQKGKGGILIYFDTPNRSTYKDTLRKFGNEFEKKVFEGLDVVYSPFGRKKINYKDKRSLIKLLQRKRCLLFLNIGVNTDESGSVITYDMNLNATIIHLTYKEAIEREFQKELNITLSRFRNVEFESKDMIKKMRIAAGEMSLACEYVIGLSLFLNGNFFMAEKVLSVLFLKLPNGPTFERIAIAVKKIRYEMFMTMSQAYMELYQRQCLDEDLLDAMNEYMEKANDCLKNTYEYCLNKAYYCIAKNHDSKSANEYINICKQMNVNQNWMYSLAFLKAYDNCSIGSVVSSYKKAFSVPYNIQDLIVFTEAALAAEPSRNGLRLALGILYGNVGDDKLASDCINDYLAGIHDAGKAREILVKKGLLK